jgi:hypothetical protein
MGCKNLLSNALCNIGRESTVIAAPDGSFYRRGRTLQRRSINEVELEPKRELAQGSDENKVHVKRRNRSHYFKNSESTKLSNR